MATSVNIGGGDDQFNRYKMPEVIAKVEGRGNGIKTRIVNCYEVARALHRPPGYVCKFFGCELGAQTKIDDNAGVYIVNGAFQQNVLKETLQKFIEMFVLCEGCKLPETDLKLRKNGTITQACNACGAEAPCDMTHKLCTYIMNNPPDGKKKKSDGKKDKAARRAAKAKKSNGEVDEDGDKLNRKERSSKKVAKKTVDDDSVVMVAGFGFGDNAGFVDSSITHQDDDDVQWSVDTSKEAEEARLKELGSAASILDRAPVEEDRDRAMKLRAYIDDGKKASKVLVKAEKVFGEDDAIRGLMMAATHDESLTTMVASVEERAVPVLKYLGKPMGAEAQQALLEYMDWVGVNDKKMLDVLAHILKLLWDKDILEEEQIFRWYNLPNGREDVRSKVKVVVEWLQNADEDSDDDDDEEDDDEEDDDSEE